MKTLMWLLVSVPSKLQEMGPSEDDLFSGEAEIQQV